MVWRCVAGDLTDFRYVYVVDFLPASPTLNLAGQFQSGSRLPLYAMRPNHPLGGVNGMGSTAMSLSSAGKLLPISGNVEVDASRYTRPSRRMSLESLDGAVEACLLVDGLGLIQDFNQAAEAQFAEAPEPLEGGSVSALIARYDELLFLAALQQTIHSGYGDTITVHTHDDRRIELSLHRVSSQAGRGQCCLMTVAAEREAAEERAPATLGAAALLKLDPTHSSYAPLISWLPLNGAA